MIERVTVLGDEPRRPKARWSAFEPDRRSARDATADRSGRPALAPDPGTHSIAQPERLRRR